MKHAPAVGYRNIDSAVGYGNEKEVGKSIADADVPRDQVFITTKITNSIKTKAEAQINESLASFGTDYINLVLIHWPWTYERNAAVYSAIEDAVDAAKIRSLGVSNFNIHHIDAILKTGRIKPAGNQSHGRPHGEGPRIRGNVPVVDRPY